MVSGYGINPKAQPVVLAKARTTNLDNETLDRISYQYGIPLASLLVLHLF